MRQALVTGASSDIGLAVARRFLDGGWRLVAHFRTPRPELDELLARPHATGVRIDFADAAATERQFEDHRARLAASDAFVNCAATFAAKPFAAIEAAGLLGHFAVNVVPGVLLTRLLAPAMAERGWGRIVHLSSIGVRFGGGSASYAYALSKHALEFLPADHKAWAARGVLVNVLRVGLTDTRFHRQDPTKDIARRIAQVPAGRMATPAEVAEAVLWLASERNAFMTGQVIGFAGGE